METTKQFNNLTWANLTIDYQLKASSSNRRKLVSQQSTYSKRRGNTQGHGTSL